MSLTSSASVRQIVFIKGESMLKKISLRQLVLASTLLCGTDVVLATGTIAGAGMMQFTSRTINNNGVWAGRIGTTIAGYSDVELTNTGVISALEADALRMGKGVTEGTLHNAGLIKGGAGFNAIGLYGRMKFIENTGQILNNSDTYGTVRACAEDASIDLFINKSIIENQGDGPAFQLQDKTGVRGFLHQEDGIIIGDIQLPSAGGLVFLMTGGIIKGDVITAEGAHSGVSLQAGQLKGNVVLNGNDVVMISEECSIAGRIRTNNEGQGRVALQGNFQADKFGIAEGAFQALEVGGLLGPSDATVLFTQDVRAHKVLVIEGRTLCTSGPLKLHGALEVSKGVLSVGAPTLTIGGDLSLSSQSTLEVDFKTASLQKPYIHVLGKATIDEQAVFNAKNTVSLPVGTNQVVIVRAEEQSEIGLLAPPPNTSRLHFTLDNSNGNALILKVDAQWTAGLQPNTRGIVSAIPQVKEVQGTFGKIQNELDNFSTAGEQENALGALAPIVDNSFVQQSVAAQTLYQQVIGQRFEDARFSHGSGYPSGDCLTLGWRYWGQGYGGHAKQNASNLSGTYHSHLYGIAVGADTPFFNAQGEGIVGLSLSISRLAIHHHAGADTQANGYQAALYGGWEDSTRYACWMMACAYNHYHTKRHFFFGPLELSARDAFNGWQASAYGEVGYDFEYDNWHMLPAFSLYGAYLTLGSYTQTGLDTANQKIDASHYTILKPILGIRVAYDWALSSGLAWRPSVYARVLYNLKSDRMHTTSTFTSGGFSFSTEGFVPHRLAYNVGANLTCAGDSPWIFSASYNVEFRREYRAHSGSLWVKYAW